MKICLPVIMILLFLTSSKAGQATISFRQTGSQERPMDTMSVKSLELRVVRFYVAEIEALLSNQQSISTQRHYLIDLSEKEAVQLTMEIPDFQIIDSIRITFGTDSVVNTAGLLDGDLDPTLGMYWTWQSGYVNYKLEGKYSDGEKSSEFEYHLGGYRQPYPTSRSIAFKTYGNTIHIDFDARRFIQKAATSFPLKVLSPGQTAYSLSDLFVASFILSDK